MDNKTPDLDLVIAAESMVVELKPKRAGFFARLFGSVPEKIVNAQVIKQTHYCKLPFYVLLHTEKEGVFGVDKIQRQLNIDDGNVCKPFSFGVGLREELRFASAHEAAEVVAVLAKRHKFTPKNLLH